MTKVIRQVLTGILLLFFSLESVALAPVFSVESNDHTILRHEVHTFFSLVAEENEERDLKDDCATPVELDVYSFRFPLIATGKISDNFDNPPTVRSLPIYAYNCSFII